MCACMAATILAACGDDSPAAPAAPAPTTPAMDATEVGDGAEVEDEVNELDIMDSELTPDATTIPEDAQDMEVFDSTPALDVSETDAPNADADAAPGDSQVSPGDTPVSDADVEPPNDTTEQDAQDAVPDAPEVAQEDTAPPVFTCTDTEQLELYSTRIEPLVSGNAISSCNQCHLAGVDLSIYVQGSPCETMACMIAQGFVDLESPKMSDVLAQILQAEPQSVLITSEVIEEEYQGFLEWIQFSASCHEEVCGEVQDACAGGPSETPNVPMGVLTPLGSCEEQALLDLFDDRVYAWKGRCHGCHDDCENEKWDAPCWLENPGQDAGPQELKEASALSMYNLIGIDAFDPYDPAMSMALLKPMAGNMGGVEHGGGDKFYDFADLAYQDYMVFALQYGACYQGVEPWWPTVTILEPANKSKFYEDEPLPVLSGTATDPQDGLITESAAYVWTRFLEEDEDLVLATGPGPHEIALPLGKHILTLAVTDFDGNKSSRSIKVWIKTKL
jgi:hypothetical protein